MMKFATLIKHPADWMDSPGPHGDIVITSRVRLARNIVDVPFPGWAQKQDRTDSLVKIRPAVEKLSEMKDAFSEELHKLNALKKQVLVERHLISREHAARNEGSAAVMNRKQSLSVMINEEDHLRMQSIQPGLNLKSAHKAVDRIDTALESDLEFAFDQELGYLTACPTNLGTGMRASAMLHLPALVLSDQINRVINGANKIGLAVRGIYGEGTEAMANLFQISNQSTLGQSEEEIINRLHKVIEQIIESEKNARLKLLEDRPSMLRDQVGRAYAILRYAHIIPSKEALNLLSMLRLGVDLGVFPWEGRGIIDVLLMEIQPAHLQIAAKSKLDAEERDVLRAEIVRRKLKSLSEPSTLPEADHDDDDAD
jgi:protein arginine kinase